MKDIASIKTIRKTQFKGLIKTQIAFWFSQAMKYTTNLNHYLSGSDFQYISKLGKVKTITIPVTEYCIVCSLNNKSVFMALVQIKGKTIPVFQSLNQKEKLTYDDLISYPKEEV